MTRRWLLPIAGASSFPMALLPVLSTLNFLRALRCMSPLRTIMPLGDVSR